MVRRLKCSAVYLGLLVAILSSGCRADEDDGFLFYEVQRTGNRLQAFRKYDSATSKLLMTSDFVVPMASYEDAYADMRPTQTMQYDQNSIDANMAGIALAQTRVQTTLHNTPSAAPTHPLPSASRLAHSAAAQHRIAQLHDHLRAAKPLALPTASLRAEGGETVSSPATRPAAAAASGRSAAAPRAQPRPAELSARIHLGEKFRRAAEGSTAAAAAGSAALAIPDPLRAAREAAVERLTLKHSSLQGIKDEGRDDTSGPRGGGEGDGNDDDDAAAAGGAGRGGAAPGHPAKLDKKIEAYHGVLAKAVMVLALLAVGSICTGILGVIYCWRRDANLVDPKDKSLSDEARGRGKHFGRTTPQYGSYGSARGRR